MTPNLRDEMQAVIANFGGPRLDSVTLVQWADEAFKGQPEGNFKHEHVTEWAADA